MMKKNLLPLLLIVPLGACHSNENQVPLEIQKQYQEDAHQMCQAMVDCMKEEVEKDLADEPAKREWVLGRMSRDLCLKGQYSLIGKLSTDPERPDHFVFRRENYETYARCSRAVSEANNCESRGEIHRQNPDCQKLRSLVP